MQKFISETVVILDDGVAVEVFYIILGSIVYI